MASAALLTGGCLCGAVRYEARGEPYSSGVCHCRTCQRSNGAPMVAFFSNKLSDFTLTGEVRRHRSSGHGERLFCGDCGTQLFFDDARYPDEIDIATVTLDDPAAVPPAFHIWTRSQIPWVKLDDGLPRYPERSGS